MAVNLINSNDINVVQSDTDISLETNKTTLNTIIDSRINNYTTYSTSEKVIGTWINGKPLYRKVFNNISITSSNTDLVDTQSMGISEVTKIYGALSTSTGAIFPIPLTDSSSNFSVIFWSGYAIRGRASIGSGTLVNCWVAIEYTKTTD